MNLSKLEPVAGVVVRGAVYFVIVPAVIGAAWVCGAWASIGDRFVEEYFG